MEKQRYCSQQGTQFKPLISSRKKTSFLPTANMANRSGQAAYLLAKYTPIEAIQLLKRVFPALCAHLTNTQAKFKSEDENEEVFYILC